MRILAITAMRDEGPHLAEWIAHHLAAGVDHFLIYSNACSDGTERMLDLLAGAGIVTHERLVPGAGRPVQWQALRQAGRHPLYRAAEWALVIDCDEFVSLRAPLATLGDLIAALPAGSDALAMEWRLFGNGGRMAPGAGLTVERFTRAAPDPAPLPLGRFFKSLYRVAAFRAPGVHRPRAPKGAAPAWVDGAGRPLPESLARADARINLWGLPAARDLVQLNHYVLRSGDEFMAKRRRGLPNHTARAVDLGYWAERNFNCVEDSGIGRMIPATRARLGEILALPGLGELHEAALAHHRAALARQLQDAGENRLYMQLALVAGSSPPPPPFVQGHLARLAAIRGA